ncbi:hypothetical protein TeGR_g13381, partial [Tetraparma gracilis]
YGPGAEKQVVDKLLEAQKGSVLGKLQGFYRIKTLAPNVCRVTLMAQGDAGGTIGKQAMAWGIKYTLGIVKKLQHNIALGKAKATLDCSAMEALAYHSAVCGREKMRINTEKEDLARFIFKERTKHDFEWASVKKMPFPLTNREFLGRYLSFKEPTGDLVLVFEALPDTTQVDYGANLKVVRGKVTAVCRFKPINDGTQCEVTLVQHGDAGGFVPERVMVAKIPQALSGMAEMRGFFQRDDAIDDAERSELAFIIKAKNEVYTDVENAVVDRVRDQLGEIPDSSFEKIESPDHIVEMGIYHKGGKNGIPRASTVLDEDICTPEEALAYVWDVKSRAKASLDDLEKEIDEQPNDHNQLVFNKKQTPAVIANRDFLGRAVWKKAEE